MVRLRTVLPLAAGAALALPGAAMAGSDAPPTLPAIVNVPMVRTAASLDDASSAVESGDGAGAVNPLKAVRRNLIRSYLGARYILAHPPAPPAEEGRARAATYKFMARRAIRKSHRRNFRGGKHISWITARKSDDGPAGPVIADGPTAVFAVLTNQYEAATTAVNLMGDTTGALLNRVQTTLNTSIILRNRLVNAVHAAEPAPPAEEGRARAAQEEGEVPTYAPLMPGLNTLIDDEIQQMQAAVENTTTPAAAKTALAAAIAADKQIEAKVTTWWPPAPAEG